MKWIPTDVLDEVPADEAPSPGTPRDVKPERTPRASKPSKPDGAPRPGTWVVFSPCCSHHEYPEALNASESFSALVLHRR